MPACSSAGAPGSPPPPVSVTASVPGPGRARERCGLHVGAAAQRTERGGVVRVRRYPCGVLLGHHPAFLGHGFREKYLSSCRQQRVCSLPGGQVPREAPEQAAVPTCSCLSFSEQSGFCSATTLNRLGSFVMQLSSSPWRQLDSGLSGKFYYSVDVSRNLGLVCTIRHCRCRSRRREEGDGDVAKLDGGEVPGWVSQLFPRPGAPQSPCLRCPRAWVLSAPPARSGRGGLSENSVRPGDLPGRASGGRIGSTESGSWSWGQTTPCPPTSLSS